MSMKFRVFGSMVEAFNYARFVGGQVTREGRYSWRVDWLDR